MACGSLPAAWQIIGDENEVRQNMKKRNVEYRKEIVVVTTKPLDAHERINRYFTLLCLSRKLS